MDRNLTMGEDLNIIFPAILDAERIVVLEEGCFYHYRFVEVSMAHKYNSKLHQKIELLYGTLQTMIEKKIEQKAEKEHFLYLLKKEYIFLMFLVLNQF